MTLLWNVYSLYCSASTFNGLYVITQVKTNNNRSRRLLFYLFHFISEIDLWNWLIEFIHEFSSRHLLLGITETALPISGGPTPLKSNQYTGNVLHLRSNAWIKCSTVNKTSICGRVFDRADVPAGGRAAWGRGFFHASFLCYLPSCGGGSPKPSSQHIS